MSLPLPALDRLFIRLQATYGRDFMSRYEGVDINAVKTSWAHELSGYSKNMMPLAWALENLPERCPNVIEFRALCRRAPAAEVPALPEPKADPERVKAEIAKLGEIKTVPQEAGRFDWAHRILARQASGAKVSPTVVQMAQSAIGAT